MRYTEINKETREYVEDMMLMNLHVMSLCYTKEYELKIPIIRVIYKLLEGDYTDEEVVGIFNTNASIFSNVLVSIGGNGELSISGLNTFVNYNDRYFPSSGSANDKLFKYKEVNRRVWFGDSDIINSPMLPRIKEVVNVSMSNVGLFYKIIKDNPKDISIDLDTCHTMYFRDYILPVVFERFNVA